MGDCFEVIDFKEGDDTEGLMQIVGIYLDF